MKKTELTILSLILTEAIFLLLFFKYSLLNISLGLLLGITLIYITKNIKKNRVTMHILCISGIFLYLFLLYKLVFFISNNILKNHSLSLITISLVIISFYLTKKKEHLFIKTTEIIFYIILFIKTITFILTIPLLKFSNFTIDLNYSYQLLYVSFFVLFLYKSIYYLNNYSLKKKELILSFTNSILIKLTSLLILGKKLFTIYQYPYVKHLQKIKYFDFIERIEGILLFEYLLCFIILISYLLLIIKNTILNYKFSLVQEKPSDTK